MAHSRGHIDGVSRNKLRRDYRWLRDLIRPEIRKKKVERTTVRTRITRQRIRALKEPETRGMGNNAKPVSYNLQLETRSRQPRSGLLVERARFRGNLHGSIINGFLRKSGPPFINNKSSSFACARARMKNPIAHSHGKTCPRRRFVLFRDYARAFPEKIAYEIFMSRVSRLYEYRSFVELT